LETSLITVLIHSKPKEIAELYYKYREVFLYFGKKYGVDIDTMADIYQEAFVVLRKHAIQGKLDAIDSSLKTYLFGIGKRMIFNYHKKNKNIIPLESKLHITDNEIVEIDFNNTPEPTVEQQLLRVFFDKLGKKCQEVLILFYYRGLSIEEIVEKSGYDNINVVSSQKSRCLKQLKEMINPQKT